VIRCKLSLLMGRDKLKIADVARATGLSRSTLSALYQEVTVRVEVEAIDKLCSLFKCGVGDLFEHVSDDSVTTIQKH
jgi:putative transcriptional regulator